MGVKASHVREKEQDGRLAAGRRTTNTREEVTAPLGNASKANKQRIAHGGLEPTSDSL